MNKIEVFENERASNYENFVKIWIPNYHYFLDCLPKLLKEIGDKKLLVVGCGTGNEIERFIKAPESWKITGVDPSPEMICQATDRFKGCENVDLIEGTLSNVSSKYSAATLILVLHFFQDNGEKLDLLREIASKLKKDAKLIMLDITGNKKQLSENLEEFRLMLPDKLDKTEINRRINRIKNELCTVSEERLSELLQEAGFEIPLRFYQSSIYMGWITRKK